MNRIFYSFLTLSVCIIFSFKAISQIDIKTGYIATFYNYDELDDIISQYNTMTPDRLDDLGSLNVAHGIDVGFRYTVNNIAYTLGYQLLIDGSRVNFVNNVQQELKFRYRHHGINAGIESYFGILGFGSALQYNILRIRGEKGITGFSTLSSINYFSAKFYLVISRNKVSIQPFIEFPFGGTHSLDGVANFLDVESSSAAKKPLTFGIKLLLFNGQE